MIRRAGGGLSYGGVRGIMAAAVGGPGRAMDKSYNLFFAMVMGTFVIAIVLAILGMAVWYR
jgi:hypothetical protein